jgi:hypothetical protein
MTIQYPTKAPVLLRLGRRWSLTVVALVVTLIGSLALAGPAHATSTGSYSVTTWNQPQIYNVRTFSTSPNLPVPQTVPSSGIVSTISITQQWTTAPAGDQYGGYLRANISSGNLCFGVNALGGDSYWTSSGNVSQYAIPATATWYLMAFIDDGSTGNIYAAVNPSRYLMAAGRNMTISYTY